MPRASATRLLLTGGCGFIGSNYVHYLLHRAGVGDHETCCPGFAPFATTSTDELTILNVDTLTYAGDPRNVASFEGETAYRFERADICDAATVDRIVDDFAPDAIIHLAAESHVDRSIESGDVFVRTNVLGTQVLLEAARRHDVPHFLHVSTDEVYGSIREGSFSESSTLGPTSPYSASKAASDLLVLAHHHTYGLPVQITRCTNNYGPRQNPEKLLPKTILRALGRQRIPVYGDGMNVRDWLFVMDHVAAIEHVRTMATWGEVYNIAGGVEKPNLDLVRIILDRVKAPSDLIEFVKDRPGHDWRYSLDDSKLRATGWAPKVGFDEGIDATIQWYRDGGVR